MVVINLKKRKISEFEEDSELEEITVDSLTKEKEILFLLFLFQKTLLPGIWNRIKTFLTCLNTMITRKHYLGIYMP